MKTSTDSEIKHEISVFAAFKKHLTIFIVGISLLWLGWYASGGQLSLYAWPGYISLAWVFVLIVHLLIAYSSFRKKNQPS